MLYVYDLLKGTSVAMFNILGSAEGGVLQFCPPALGPHRAAPSRGLLPEENIWFDFNKTPSTFYSTIVKHPTFPSVITSKTSLINMYFLISIRTRQIFPNAPEWRCSPKLRCVTNNGEVSVVFCAAAAAAAAAWIAQRGPGGCWKLTAAQHSAAAGERGLVLDFTIMQTGNIQTKA